MDAAIFRRWTSFIALSLLAVSCADLGDPVGVSRPSAPNFALTADDPIELVGDAAFVENSGLRLSGSGAGSSGAAWHDVKQRLNGGFESEFKFKLTPSGNRKQDGFAFVVQGDAGDAIGGGDFAYEGLEKSVAVLFDTRSTPTRVSVQTAGDISSTAPSATLSPALNNANEQIALVSYWADTLKVKVNGVTVLKVQIDLTAVTGLLDGNNEAWVGFTSASHPSGTGQTHDIIDWTFRDSDADYPVYVTVKNGNAGLPNVTAVATNIETGQSHPLITGTGGIANFLLPIGEYIFSAYRFAIDDPAQLVIWPYEVENSGSPGVPAFAPVISVNGSSVTKTEQSLLDALEAPYRVGPDGVRNLLLAFSVTTNVQCTLLDPTGKAVNANKLFGITPVGNSSSLPPLFIPPGFTGWTPAQLAALPGGFGFGTQELSDGCILKGAAPGLFALETAPITQNGNTFVLRAGGNVGAGGTVDAIAGPSPQFAATNWFLDEPINNRAADPTGPRDFGPLVYGFTAGTTNTDGTVNPTNTFAVGAQFKGQGKYIVEFYSGVPGPTTFLGSVGASCAQQKCSTSGLSLATGVTGSATGVSMRKSGDDWGTVVFEVTASGLTEACFIIIAGGSSASPSDVLPTGTPYLCADRVPGRGQTFILAGRM